MSETRKDNNASSKPGQSGKKDNYVLKVEDNKGYNSEYQSNRPSKNGEIYFANYQRDQRSAKAGRQAPVKTYQGNGNQGDTRMFAPAAVRDEKGSRNIRSASPRQQRPQQRSSQPGAGSTPRDRYKAAASPKNANSKMESSRNRVRDNRPLRDNFKSEKSRSSEEKIEKKKNRAMRRREPNYIKRVIFSVICIVLVTCLLSTVSIGCINDILAINGSSDEITVTIPENSSAGDIIGILSDNGLIHNQLFCRMFAKLRGYYNYNDYISGVYDLKTDMGLEGMLGEMRESGAYSDDEVVTLSFPEGWTVQQIMNRLVENEVITKEKFIRALNFDYEYKFINGDKNACIPLEGVMFPDTYEFFIGESAGSIIRKFLDNFNDKWTA